MTPRTIATRIASHALSRALKVPPPTSDFTVVRGVRVPMRDGIELTADHYEPQTPSPAGTLLVRVPYGRGFPFSTLFGAFYAARGYHVVLQSVRGTFGSGGEFTPMVNEVADGADTVAWLREQPWFTGTFATLGLSYLGFTQWALLMDPPPEMVAAIIIIGPHDFAESICGTGAFSLDDYLGWSDMLTHQEDPGRLKGLVRLQRGGGPVRRATNEVPLGEAGRALLKTGAPWWESWVEHPDCSDPFWAATRLTEALDRVRCPVLLFGGWQDVFLQQTLAQFIHLRGRDVTTALTVGPWTHRQVMTGGGIVVRESLTWLDAHLGGKTVAPRSPVRTYVNKGQWIDLPDWPPVMPERIVYLQPAHGLSESPPDGFAPPSTFTFDPANPTPTIGGRLLSAKAGYRDDTSLAMRADVADFTGDPLPDDLYVVGNPVIELSHTSDNPNHDVFVRLCEVDPDGRSTNVSDGFVRRTTASDTTLTLELDAVAHGFPAGSRMRVLIAGGSHPRFARNLGTGEPPISGTRMAPATHTIHHGAGGLSRLVLPAGPRLPSTD